MSEQALLKGSKGNLLQTTLLLDWTTGGTCDICHCNYPKDAQKKFKL